MSARDICDLAQDDGLFPDTFSGLTPWQTMKAKISVDIRKNPRSRFVRTEPGRFALRSQLGAGYGYSGSPLAPSRDDDSVVCISSQALDAYGRFRGVQLTGTRLLDFLRERGELHYVPRLEAETRADLKQVICYVLVRRADQLLSYKRGTFNRVEDFLRGAYCVGFGGHVVNSDTSLFEPAPAVVAAAVRELHEELLIPASEAPYAQDACRYTVLGALNDDSSHVGVRHIAFILVYDVAQPSDWDSPQRGEKAITQLRWLGPDEARNLFRNFEYWSQLCLSALWHETVTGRAAWQMVARRSREIRAGLPFCIVGRVGCGKTEATDVLRNEFGFTEVNSGKIVTRLIGREPADDVTREAFSADAARFISTEKGPRELAAALAAEVSKLRGHRVLIDGIRHRSTLRELSAALGRKPYVVYVHTPPHVAYGFYAEREGSDRTYQGFCDLWHGDVEREVERLLGRADAVLYNWTGKREYRNAVAELIGELNL